MKIIARSFIPIVVALFCVAPALVAQDFDFKTLDKLGARAKSSTNVTLSGDLLKMAASFLGSDNDKDAASIQSLVGKLKGIYVRAWEFEKPGEYSEGDLAPLRALLKQSKWKAVVDVKDDKEWTQVFLLPTANNKLGGVAVVSTEPTSLTVVYIDGEINPEDLHKLSGNLGVPEIRGLDGKLGDLKGDNKKKTSK